MQNFLSSSVPGLIVAATLAFATSGAQASVLAGNALTSNGTGNRTFNNGLADRRVAENFSLTENATIDSFTVDVGVSGGLPSSTSANWSIRAGGTAPGAVLFSGTTNGIYVDTGKKFRCCSSYAIYNLNFDISDIKLSSGSYWLALRVATTGNSVYWADTTTGDNKLATTDNNGASWSITAANRAFAINGTVDVPEPTTIFLSGLGLAAMMLSRRARRAR